MVLKALFAAAVPANGQEYRSVIYQTEQGLPTNLTKGIIEDEQGFVWVATDAGVIRYDGRRFSTYTNALNSSYPKGFLKTSEGDILIYHDDGIAKISGHTNEDIELETVIPGSGNPTPNTVNYPKGLYEDTGGDIWISEVYTVARYTPDSRELERYFLPDRYRTSSFVRSFEFQETGANTLILSSQQGYVFYFDEQQETFELIENTPDFGTINTMLYEPETDAVWIGTANGIFALHEQTPGEGDFAFTQVSERSGISKLRHASDGRIWAGGWNTNETGVLVFTKHAEHGWQWTELPDFELNSVNDFFSSDAGHTWVATDAGLALYYQGFFSQVPIEQQRKYVQSISRKPQPEGSRDGESIVYYMTDASWIYEIRTHTPFDGYDIDVRFENPEMDDLLSVSASEEGVWATSSRGQIYYLPHSSPNEEPRVLTVEDEDNSIFYSLADSDNHLWYLTYNDNAVKRMSPEGQRRVYRQHHGVDEPGSVLRTHPETGQLYVASAGQLSVMQYSVASDRFEPLPARTPELEDHASVFINDMQVLASGDVLLATSRGLFYYDAEQERYQPYALNSYLDNQYLKSLTLSGQNRFIWIGTDTGLYMLDRDSGHLSRFGEQIDGLPSLTLAARGLDADPKGRIWLATSAGMAHSRGSLELAESRTPELLSTLVNNVHVGPEKAPEVNTNAILQFNVASLMYPGGGIRYQVRHGAAKTWEDVGSDGIITVSELSLGNHELEVRALQSGAHRWSAPLVIPYQVLPPWYFQIQFILLYILAIALLTSGVTRFYTIRLRRSKMELERIVQMRLQEIKQKNKDLSKAKQEAEKANRAKSEFLANMSHEIRTPLNGVIGFIDILQASGLNQQQKEYANYVASSANTLMQLINQVLDLSKADAGQIELDPQPVALDVICDTTVNIIHVAASKKDLPIYLFTDPKLPHRVMADELRLRQVLINLLGNAVKFTEKGYVELSVKVQDAAPGSENSANGEEHTQLLRFEVIDTGIGIPKDKAAQIFTPFSQVDPSTTRKYGGTGLGLSISKSIIEKMGGKLNVQSREGKGSRFYFDVPLPVTQSSSSRIPPVLADKKRTAWVISASRRHGRILYSYLEHLNISPVQFTSVEETRNAQTLPEIVIADSGAVPGGPSLNEMIEFLYELHELDGSFMIGIPGPLHPGEAKPDYPEKLQTLPLPVRYRTLRAALKQALRKPGPDDDEAYDFSAPEEATYMPGDFSEEKQGAEPMLPVLLVDDNSINLKLAETLLRRCVKHTIEVHTAENGEQAIQRVSENQYALILMDIQMPVMDGFTATRRIRALEQQSGSGQSRIPIVALTAGVSHKEQNKCYEAGMDDFISKPVSFDKFRMIVQKWLPDKASSYLLGNPRL